MFNGKKWVFQQDGASSHTSNKAQNWCKNNFDSFLDKFHWPPNSPDLNPLDYFYWNEVENIMVHTPFMSLIELKAEIRRACSLISQDLIKKAVSSFTSRVRAVENLKGAYLDKRKINRN